MIVKMLAAEVINKEINKCVTTEACRAPRPSDHRGPLLSVLTNGEARKVGKHFVLAHRPHRWKLHRERISFFLCKVDSSVSKLPNNRKCYQRVQEMGFLPPSFQIRLPFLST